MSNPPPKFYFNGQAYGSVEKMPEEVRKLFKDENQNGMPDFLENMFGQNLAGIMNNPTFQKFAFKDKIFDKLEQLPPKEQLKVREKLEKLNAFFNSQGSTQNSSSSAVSNLSFSPQSLSPSVSASLGGAYSPIKTGSNKAILFLTIVIGIFIFMIAIALFVFLPGK